jgi:hypothetical protein
MGGGGVGSGGSGWEVSGVGVGLGRLLTLDLENAFHTISHRSFLVELYQCPALHPIISLVEMIYSWDSTVNRFTQLNRQPCTPLSPCKREYDKVMILLAYFLFNLAIGIPSRLLRSGAAFSLRYKPSLMMEIM